MYRWSQVFLAVDPKMMRKERMGTEGREDTEGTGGTEDTEAEVASCGQPTNGFHGSFGARTPGVVPL